MVSSERAALMYTLNMERNYIGALVEGFDSTGEFKRPVNALVSLRPRPFPAAPLPPSFSPFLILTLFPLSLVPDAAFGCQCHSDFGILERVDTGSGRDLSTRAGCFRLGVVLAPQWGIPRPRFSPRLFFSPFHGGAPRTLAR